MSKTTILAIVAFAMLVLLIVGASYSNSQKFYLKANDGALEIWQGIFAPMGEEKVVTLPGVSAPEPIREVYAKEDVFPLAFTYYITQADKLLDVPGMPDFEGIKAQLHHARQFAVSPELEKMVRIRIDYIDLFILRYKAEVAAAKGGLEDLDAAIGFLEEAEKLAIQDDDSAEISNRINALKTIKDQVGEAAAAEEAKRAAEEKAAAEAAREAEERAAVEAEQEAAQGAVQAPAKEAEPTTAEKPPEDAVITAEPEKEAPGGH